MGCLNLGTGLDLVQLGAPRFPDMGPDEARIAGNTMKDLAIHAAI